MPTIKAYSKARNIKRSTDSQPPTGLLVPTRTGAILGVQRSYFDFPEIGLPAIQKSRGSCGVAALGGRNKVVSSW